MIALVIIFKNTGKSRPDPFAAGVAVGALRSRNPCGNLVFIRMGFCVFRDSWITSFIIAIVCIEDMA